VEIFGIIWFCFYFVLINTKAVGFSRQFLNKQTLQKWLRPITKLNRRKEQLRLTPPRGHSS